MGPQSLQALPELQSPQNVVLQPHILIEGELVDIGVVRKNLKEALKENFEVILGTVGGASDKEICSIIKNNLSYTPAFMRA